MIHHVYANQSNIGDWLSARGIQSLLAPAHIEEHFCDEPFVAETLRRLALTSEEDFIIIGGGGLFMNYFAPFWEGFREIARRRAFCIWGVGCCDHKNSQSRLPATLVAGILRESRLSVVRDDLMRSVLNRADLPSPVPCPAINAVPRLEGGRARLLHVDHFSVVGERVYDLMCRTAQAFAKETGRTYRTTNNLVRAGDHRALDRTLKLYASADLVLTSRLHGCIIGLAMGRKVLAVSGDRKVESFMHAAGLGEWVCDVADVTSLPGRLAGLQRQPEPRTFIEWVREANASVAEKVRALVAQTFFPLARA